jgi:hypothetical protein
MNENRFPQGLARGLFFVFFNMLCTGFVIYAMIISVDYPYSQHPSCPEGRIGAGFPVLFICDDWGANSPLGSAGGITPIDVTNGGIYLEGFLVDFLFYAVLFYTPVLVIYAVCSTESPLILVCYYSLQPLACCSGQS